MTESITKCLRGITPYLELSIRASTIQVSDCGNPRSRRCGGRLSFQVVSHFFAHLHECIWFFVVFFFCTVLIKYFVTEKEKMQPFSPKGRAFVTKCLGRIAENRCKCLGRSVGILMY